jgi:hypothetical protein
MITRRCGLCRNWHRGFSFTLFRWHWWCGVGHDWSPRYCITWLGLISYWHMHGDDPEFTTGFSWNRSYWGDD